MKKKMKLKRPARVEVDNPQPKKKAKTTIPKPSIVEFVLGVPSAPNVPDAPVSLTTPHEGEFNDGLDPLFTYPSPLARVTMEEGEAPLEKIKRPSLEQRAVVKIKLVNLEVPTTSETQAVSHGPGHGKTPNAETKVAMKRASDEVISLDEDEEMPLVDEDGDDLVLDQSKIPQT